MTGKQNREGYTTAEMKDMYDISDAAVRMSIKRGRLIEEVDCTKIGNSWLVYKDVAERLWGHRKKIK